MDLEDGSCTCKGQTVFVEAVRDCQSCEYHQDHPDCKLDGTTDTTKPDSSEADPKTDPKCDEGSFLN